MIKTVEQQSGHGSTEEAVQQQPSDHQPTVDSAAAEWPLANKISITKIKILIT